MAVVTFDDCFQAIAGQWATKGLDASFPGSIYAFDTPPSLRASRPRCVVTPVAGAVQMRTNAGTYWTFPVDLHVIDATPERAGAALRLVLAAFDRDQQLTPPNGRFVVMLPRAQQAFEEDLYYRTVLTCDIRLSV